MLTQDEYKLYTNQTVSYATADWEKLVDLAAARLAYFLCLEKLPTNEEGELAEDLKLLLANFLYAMLTERGSNQQIASKSVRNFSISYVDNGAAQNAFAKISNTYGDIVAKYSECEGGLCVEKTVRRCCHECF